MTLRILTLFLFFSQISFGQNGTVDCAKMIDRELLIMKNGLDSLPSDIRVFQQCGKIDSIDTKIFLSGPVLGMMTVSLTNDHKKVTYREIINLIEQFKTARGYQQLREREIPLTSNTQTVHKELKSELFVDVNDAVQKSKQLNKLTLIYFTGFSSAGSRKMEQTVLSDENITTILFKNYVIYRANVDDKTKLDDKSTVGSKNIKIQQQKFKHESQPYFVVLDKNGKFVAECLYTNDVKEFSDFLNKGLSNL